jgi:hypothetical protein
MSSPNYSVMDFYYVCWGEKLIKTENNFHAMKEIFIYNFLDHCVKVAKQFRLSLASSGCVVISFLLKFHIFVGVFHDTKIKPRENKKKATGLF